MNDCFLLGGVVRARRERIVLWCMIFHSHYARLPGDKARFLTRMLRAYDRPGWEIDRIRMWESLRRMPH